MKDYELKVDSGKLKVIYMVQKIAPYDFSIKICSILNSLDLINF